MKSLSELTCAERQRLCAFNFAGGPIDDVGDAEIAFAAFGVAAMAWARLETHIDVVLIQVNKRRFSRELHDPDHPVSFSKKLRLLKVWFNKHKALAKYRTKIKLVAERATALSWVRNELLHALLESYDPKGQKIVSKTINFIESDQFRVRRHEFDVTRVIRFAQHANAVNRNLGYVSADLFTAGAVEQLQEP